MNARLRTLLMATSSILWAACHGFTGPSPHIDAVNPNRGANTINVPIQILGSGFSPLAVNASKGNPEPSIPAVFLEGASRIQLTATFVSANQLNAVVPAGIALGVYGLTVQNPDGRSVTLAQAYTAIPPQALQVTGITPPFGWTGSSTSVSISGAGFLSTPRVELLTSPPTELTHVAFLGDTTLSGVVPSGLQVGTYTVRVINPDGSQGDLTNAFTVTATAPPSVTSVTPSLSTTNATQDIIITGTNFPSSPTVSFVNSAGAEFPIVVGASSTNSISATVPTSIAVGNYLVRVKRTSDGAYGDWVIFTVTAPSGNPGPWGSQPTLPGGRRGLGTAVARDDLGNAYLYAVGGFVTDNSGAKLETLQDVPFAPVTAFGDLTKWNANLSLLTKRRSQPAVFAVNGYLYAAGGADETGTALSDIEQAKVLRWAGAPQSLTATSASGGNLGAGTWYYRISAVVSDTDNPGGETLPSDFAVVTVAADAKVSLNWQAPTEGTVTTYRIYRTPAANDALGAERLLNTVTTTAFSDDGTLDTGTASPLPAGSLGNWVNLGTSLNPARYGAAVAVARIPNGSGGYSGSEVYLVGGTTNGTNPLNTYARAALPTSGAFSGPIATDATNILLSGRYEASAHSADPANAKDIPAGGSFVYLVGGQDPSQSNPNLRFPSNFQAGTVQTDGTLHWSALTTGSGAAGPVCVVANDYVWQIGGWGGAGNYPTNVSNGKISAAPPALVNFQSTGQSLLGGARYQSGGTYFRSHLFVVGGSSDGKDSLDTSISSVF